MQTPTLAESMLHAIGKNMKFFWQHAHPDLVLEFPYAPTHGMPARLAGRDNIEPYLDNVAKLLPGLTYTDVKVQPLASPGAWVLEYGGDCPAANHYTQKYIAIMRFEGDRLILFREYWDTTEVNRALGAPAAAFR